MTKVRTFYGHQGNIRPPHGLISKAASESEAPESEVTTAAEALALAGVPEELANEVLSELGENDEIVSIESEELTEGETEDEVVVTVDGSTEVPADEIVEIVGEKLTPEEEAALEASGEEVPVLTDEVDANAVPDVEGMNKEELQDLAETLGVDPSGRIDHLRSRVAKALKED